jgi:hypothetical protein
MASDAGVDSSDFDAFESEFQAIVELASAVLQARESGLSPTSTSTASPIEPSPASSGLDVQGPLCK